MTCIDNLEGQVFPDSYIYFSLGAFLSSPSWRYVFFTSLILTLLVFAILLFCLLYSIPNEAFFEVTVSAGTDAVRSWQPQDEEMRMW